MLNVPDGAQVLPSVRLNPENDWVAVVSGEPRLLLFPADQLPRLERGKGVRLMQLPKEEQLRAVGRWRPGCRLQVATSDYVKIFTAGQLESARSERARRGMSLPRTLKQAVAVGPDPDCTSD